MRRWLLGLGGATLATLCAQGAWAQDEAPAVEPAPEAEEAVEAVVPAAPPEAPPAYAPRFAWEPGGMRLEIPLSLAERVEGVSGFEVDRDGTRYEPDLAFNTQIRVGAYFNSRRELAPVRLVAEFEEDVLTGLHAGGADLEGEFVPDTGKAEAQLRKASLQVDFGPFVHVSGGFMTSHWGLGLVANDGAHGWTPGSAQFIDPRGGDLVLRGLFVMGPFGDDGLIVAVGADQVQSDDIMIDGDEAFQVVTSVLYGVRKPFKLGAYAVSRNQKAVDGDRLNVGVFDIFAQWKGDLGDLGKLELGAEAVLINGTTTLAPSTEFLEHDVRQFGMAVRGGLDLGGYGFVADVLFASGDDNFDDDTQSGFRTDVNYPMGLIMHRHLMAAQTSRAPITASNPDLVGIPSEDLERFPSRGSVTNTLAFFPRGWVRIGSGLEIFGGPLVAFSPSRVADPFNSRIGGGTPRNAIDGESGSYLGTEFDLGARYRRIIAGSELTLSLEGGVLMPGDAFVDDEDKALDPITLGRATLQYRF